MEKVILFLSLFCSTSFAMDQKLEVDETRKVIRERGHEMVEICSNECLNAGENTGTKACMMGCAIEYGLVYREFLATKYTEQCQGKTWDEEWSYERAKKPSVRGFFRSLDVLEKLKKDSEIRKCVQAKFGIVNRRMLLQKEEKGSTSRETVKPAANPLILGLAPETRKSTSS